MCVSSFICFFFCFLASIDHMYREHYSSNGIGQRGPKAFVSMHKQGSRRTTMACSARAGAVRASTGAQRIQRWLACRRSLRTIAVACFPTNLLLRTRSASRAWRPSCGEFQATLTEDTTPRRDSTRRASGISRPFGCRRGEQLLHLTPQAMYYLAYFPRKDL